MTKLIDLSGKRFGKLLVIARNTASKKRLVHWNCRCDCGHEVSVAGGNLRSGHSTGCKKCSHIQHGCAKRGQQTRAHKAWAAMKDRCLNSNNKRFKDYGGRGIAICQAWIDSFAAFLKDMGEPPPGMSIDRIDNDKGYSPENCRWATAMTQSQNNRRARLITANGKTLCISGWIRELGLQSSRVWPALRRGVTPESVLFGNGGKR